MKLYDHISPDNINNINNLCCFAPHRQSQTFTLWWHSQLSLPGDSFISPMSMSLLALRSDLAYFLLPEVHFMPWQVQKTRQLFNSKQTSKPVPVLLCWHIYSSHLFNHNFSVFHDNSTIYRWWKHDRPHQCSESPESKHRQPTKGH